MIISASRRTDIPALYSEWFLNRIREGFLYVRNPLNPRQISRIDLSPGLVDCIVFWTKNPAPMLDRLEALKGYTYYFQFTLTGYGTDMEANLPDKEKVLIPVFQRLASQTGSERVIWRYDPILFTDTYSVEYHLRTFERFASLLAGYTEQCVISFVDIYAKNRKRLAAAGVRSPEGAELQRFARHIADIAHQNHMTVAACAEAMDLEACGIAHGSCIDRALIERLTGYRIRAGKDKGQRPECGCVESVEIGTYNTCTNGCQYCYASSGSQALRDKCSLYDPDSPLLCGEPVSSRDKVTVRDMASLKGEALNTPEQLSIFEC